MLPNTFEEVLVRLYCKKESYNEDKAKVVKLEDAFRNWIKKNCDHYSLPFNSE
jgi:hypothetical protein